MNKQQRKQIEKDLRTNGISVPRGMSDFILAVYSVENGVRRWKR